MFAPIGPRLIRPVSSRQDTTNVSSTPALGYDELWLLQNEFYERFMYPNNIKEARAINSTIFSDDVGFIHPERTSD